MIELVIEFAQRATNEQAPELGELAFDFWKLLPVEVRLYAIQEGLPRVKERFGGV